MEIQCTSCQKRLRLPDNAAGKKFKCPSCQHILTVPSASTPPAAPHTPTPTSSPMITNKLGIMEKTHSTASMLSMSEPKSAVLDLPPEVQQPQEAPAPTTSPSTPTSIPITPPTSSTSAPIPPEQIRNLIRVLESCKMDIDRSMRDRDDAMEMVDTFFQKFMERANNPRVKLEERTEFRDIAQKIFQLQQRFPILSGMKDALVQCENILRQLI